MATVSGHSLPLGVAATTTGEHGWHPFADQRAEQGFLALVRSKRFRWAAACRSLYAWIRTALDLVGGGFAVDQFLLDQRWGVHVALAVLLFAIGMLSALRAISR